MIVFAGSFLCVGLFFLPRAGNRASSWRTPTISTGLRAGQHEQDIRATGLMDAQRGVYVGAWCAENSHRLQYLRHNGPEHILAFAPTRSGKGVGLVIPTLLAWSESAVIYDIKGENWAKTAGFRVQQGHLCFKFSPVEENASSRFNPLSEVRLFTPRDVSDAQNIANMIVRTGEDSPQERYWQDAAASITTGMILHVCYEAALQGRVASLADLAHVFTTPGSNFRDTLEDLLNFPHDPEYKHDWRMPTGDKTATHPVVREKVQEMLDKEERDFGGVQKLGLSPSKLRQDRILDEARHAANLSSHCASSASRPSPPCTTSKPPTPNAARNEPGSREPDSPKAPRAATTRGFRALNSQESTNLRAFVCCTTPT